MILTMEPKHIDAVLALQKQWEEEEITYGVIAPTQQQLAKSLSPFCLVAVDKGEVIGFLLADVKEESNFCIFPSGSAYLEIEDLYVRKDYRSKGIGEMLLQHSEALARKRSGASFSLLSSATRDAERIRRFYESNDYQVWTTTFFKRLDEPKE